ncbi:hypothetical protein [Actinocorallia libanotica]|uniref:tetratricopeptide repeat protein n=1 Tax=Actinocorallia libanotica TaxID=46162 RepID=UPI0031D1FCF6
MSFFITARLADQSDRAAFLDVVLEQLAEITGDPEPSFLPEAMRQSRFIQLLHEAAAVCREAGERLVLLVDGLDEDRGVTEGRHAHSIAALLPVRLPEGLKVIVAGRPAPPIPTDVPAHHPLRDPGIIQTLTASDHAHVIRDVVTHELENLLEDTGVAHEVLGLVVAAGGGLSIRDLAELIDAPPWKIEKVLRGPSGRTFTGHASRWQPGTAPDVFVLAHEELQANALASLGGQVLAGFRERLHTWCDTYRSQGWPIGTPEYLLRGYFRFLHKHNDLSRMIELVVDRARLDRMLDVSGGDATALTDITTTQTTINHSPVPDLAVCLRLALTRRYLTWRNSKIPTTLPAAWARLGYPDRAESLAGSIVDPAARMQAQRNLAEAFVLVGDPARAEALAATAGTDNTSISGTNHSLPAHVLSSVVAALSQVGEVDRAEAVAHSITSPADRAFVQASLITALVSVGELDRAEAIGHALQDDSEDTAWALKSLVTSFCTSGEFHRAKQIIFRIRYIFPWLSAVNVFTRALVRAQQFDEAFGVVRTAEIVANSAPDPFTREKTRTSLVSMLVYIREASRAKSAIQSTGDMMGDAFLWRILVEAMVQVGDFEEAERVTFTAPKPYAELQASQALVPALIEAGELDRAEAAARSLPDPNMRIYALCALIPAFTTAGDLDSAHRICGEVEHVAFTEIDLRSQAFSKLSSALTEAGDLARARVAANAITEASDRSEPFSALLAKMVSMGDLEAAEEIHWSVTDTAVQDRALSTLVPALVRAGRRSRAQRVIESIELAARSNHDPAERSRTLGTLALALIQTHDFSGAEETVNRIADTTARTHALVSLIPGLVQQGEYERAETIAYSPTDPVIRVQAVISLMTAWLKADEPERVRAVIHTAEEMIGLLADNRTQTADLSALVSVLIGLNELDHAERTARSIPDPVVKQSALITILPSLMEGGRFSHALEIVQEVETTTAQSVTDPISRIHILHALVPVLIQAGDTGFVQRIISMAEGLIDNLPEHFLRAIAIAGHVKVLVLVKEYSRVVEVIGSIDNSMDRQYACQAAIEALVSAGQFDIAEAIANSTVDIVNQIQGVNKLVESLAEAGEFERAESAYRTLEPSLLQTGARALASAWSEAGGTEQAERIARSITGSALRAQTLAEIAQRADSARRRWLLSEALAETPDVISLLEPIARFSPSALLENAPCVDLP